MIKLCQSSRKIFDIKTLKNGKFDSTSDKSPFIRIQKKDAFINTYSWTIINALFFTGSSFDRYCAWNAINHLLHLSLGKIPKFHLISWCENFVERHSFHWTSSESPEALRKLCFSKKFSHQEIRWNVDILRSVLCVLYILGCQ